MFYIVCFVVIIVSKIFEGVEVIFISLGRIFEISIVVIGIVVLILLLFFGVVMGKVDFVILFLVLLFFLLELLVFIFVFMEGK